MKKTTNLNGAAYKLPTDGISKSACGMADQGEKAYEKIQKPS